VKEYLPENCQKDYDRRMRNAYAMNHYAEAQEALQKSSGNWRGSIPALPAAWRKGWKKR
jgi:transposase-like protein